MSDGLREPDRLEPEILDYLRRGGDEVEHEPGRVIVRKGEPGVAVHFILAGEVEVTLEGSDGRSLPLCRHGPGELFGELSVLRSQPTSADVKSVTPLRLLTYPAELFPTALAECDALRDLVLGRLAQKLQRSTLDGWDRFRREQAFVDLARAESDGDSLVVASPAMRAIEKKLVRLGGETAQVLVTGAPGTGRTLAARLVHRSSGNNERPLIVVDCDDLPADGSHAAIFGHSVDGDIREESDAFGALHLAHEGDLILRNLGSLALQEQQCLGGYMRLIRIGHIIEFPKVRILATAHDLTDPAYETEIAPSLKKEFGEVIRLPPLVGRPRDIVPLARHFLSQIDGDGKRTFTEDAERALVSLPYSMRNVAELRSVVEMATRCAAEDEIRADHIFSGLGEEEPFGLALGRPPLVMRLLEGGGLGLLRGATLVFFLVAIALCVFAGATVAGRLANGFIWSVWEPVVFGLFLLGGALWCTVCPLSTAGKLAKRTVNLGRPPPSWTNGWLAAAVPVVGFFAILWVERIFHMTWFPLGSGLLLLSLVLLSVGFCVVYEREVWCRFVCPLGRLAVVLAPAAPVSVAADRTICASTCTTHACYKGTEGVAGCPVFHHPLMTSEAHHCKLCGSCLRSCPHESAGLYLRPPGQGGWRLGGTGSYPTTFAVGLLLIASLFLAAETTTVMGRPATLTLTGVGLVVAGLWLGRRLPGWLGRGGENRAAAQRVAASLAVLAWGPLMAGQFHNVGLLGDLTLQSRAGGAWLGPLNRGVPLLPLAGAAVVLFAAGASAIMLRQAWKRSAEAPMPTARTAWGGLAGVWLISTALSLVLVL